MTERKETVQQAHELPFTRRCALLAAARSTAYYQARAIDESDLTLMRLIDEIHLQYPFYGSRHMRDELEVHGHRVNRKRVRRLMRLMGPVRAVSKPRTSQPGKGHKIYPYLLRGLEIDRPNRVWATDICYSAPSLGRRPEDVARA